MTFQSPWGQPSYKKTRKKAKKTKKKARKAKKVRKKVKKKAKKRASPRRKKAAPRRRGRRAAGVRVIVSKADLAKIRKSVARPKWMDLLPDKKRKIFRHEGKTYWPLYSLLYVVDAVEVVPLSQWSGPTSTKPFGALLKPGFVKKIGSRKYVYVEHAQFIQKGSPIDV